MSEENKKIKELIKEYNKLDEHEQNDFLCKIRTEERAAADQRYKDFAAEKEAKFVGKCYKRNFKLKGSLFPKMYKYYKVLNFRYSGNQNMPEMLTFCEYPTYWFEYQAHLAGQAGDYFLGVTDFDGIQVEEIPFADGGSFTEISPEEYKEAMMKYTERLADLKFTTEHWRAGGVLPGEDKWYKKDG